MEAVSGPDPPGTARMPLRRSEMFVERDKNDRLAP